MLIRHKITAWFIVMSGLLLCLFSVYIYIASSNARKLAFQTRIKNKAFAIKEIYHVHNEVAEHTITSIPEQSAYVFNEHDSLIYSIGNIPDYDFNRKFFQSVADEKERYFEYKQRGGRDVKEGYAFVNWENGKRRTIMVTAYDKPGFDQLRDLGIILVAGNLFFLIVVGLAGYVFSSNTVRPFRDLARQAESAKGNDLNFRLRYANPADEIGVVTDSFNKALARIQSLAESQKSFISYASHELRTPLTALSGLIETSLTYDNDVEAIRKSQRDAQKEIQKATDLVNSLLQLAKIESTSGIEKERLNIVDVLLDSISFFKLKTPDQEFRFEILEPDSEELYVEVMGNSHLLQTAFGNLIDNASKYSNKQKIAISLSVIGHAQICIRIVDTGIGVNPADIDHILEPLFRGKNTGGVDGFGLGLALTQRILFLHGGSLVLTNNDTGMTAEIILPAMVNRSGD